MRISSLFLGALIYFIVAMGIGAYKELPGAYGWAIGRAFFWFMLLLCVLKSLVRRWNLARLAKRTRMLLSVLLHGTLWIFLAFLIFGPFSGASLEILVFIITILPIVAMSVYLLSDLWHKFADDKDGKDGGGEPGASQ